MLTFETLGTLLALCAVMFFGSLLFAYIPFALTLSPAKVRLVSVFGAGVLVGTSFIVVLPEGVHMLWSDASRNMVRHALDDAGCGGAGAGAGPAHTGHHLLAAPTPLFNAGESPAAPAFGAQHEVYDHPHSVALSPAQPWSGESHSHQHGPSDHSSHGHGHGHDEFSPHAVGLALASGFVFMMLVDRVGGGHGHSHGHSHGHGPGAPAYAPLRVNALDAAADGDVEMETPRSAVEAASDTSSGAPTRRKLGGSRDSGAAGPDGSATPAFTSQVSSSAAAAAPPAHGHHAVTSSTLFGLLIHSAVDGVALGASVASGGGASAVSLVVFVAIMLHKAPAAFGLSSFMLQDRVPTRIGALAPCRPDSGAHSHMLSLVSAVLRQLLMFAASAPLGALLTFFALVGGAVTYSEATLAHCLLFSAGTFLFVATVHILPEIQQRTPGGSAVPLEWSAVAALIAGVFVPALINVEHEH